MIFTLLGILIEVKPLHSENALAAIPKVPSFNDMLVLAGIVPLYLYATFPAYTSPSGWFMYHTVPSNALYPILITLEGIIMEVKLEQPSNELLPILITLLGMVTEAKPLQSTNALDPMLVTLYVVPL